MTERSANAAFAELQDQVRELDRVVTERVLRLVQSGAPDSALNAFAVQIAGIVESIAPKSPGDKRT